MKFVCEQTQPCRNFNRGSRYYFGDDITIRHGSNAIFDAVSRSIKDATVNLGGSSFRWRNTIVRRCRWPEVCSKGHPRVRPFYCDTIYDCSDRLLSFPRRAVRIFGIHLRSSVRMAIPIRESLSPLQNFRFALLPATRKIKLLKLLCHKQENGKIEL